MSNIFLSLNLFGGFRALSSDGKILSVRGAKHRALVALLATAAGGVHSRSWIQETLWSLSGEEHGRASLRRAISDLRKIFGRSFNDLFEISNIDIRLRTDRVSLLGSSKDGEFLQGIDIPEPGFKTWLAEKRRYLENDKYQPSSISSLHIAPSIAVVPFLARSGEKMEQHFSDMVALEVTRSLSRSKLIDVISHLSSRQFSQKSMDLGVIRNTLCVDYLVYGSITLDGNRYQLDVDFTDTSSGQIRWTRTFSGSLAEIIAGGHNLAIELSHQVCQTILSASAEVAISKPLPDIESHALLMASIKLMHQHKLADFSKSRVYLEELVRRFPGHSILHAWLGKWYILSIAQGWSHDSTSDTATAVKLAGRALDINPSCSFSLAVDGMIQSNNKQEFSTASSRFEKALEIDPNNSLALLLNSRLHSFFGNGAKAVEQAEHARSLSPIDPHQYFYDILAATAYVVDGKYERAYELAERSLKANPRHISTHSVMAGTLELMGRHEEARNAALELLRRNPKISVSSYIENHPAGHLQIGRMWAEALGRAGIPKH